MMHVVTSPSESLPTSKPRRSRLMRMSHWTASQIQRVHRNECGVISLLTVFVMLGCTWLLLWVINSAKQLDARVRMQNAVDAAGHSGTAVLARGMNAIAFANQLEFDLLAAVATLRVSAAGNVPSPLVRLLPTFEELLEGSQPGTPPSQRPIPAFRYAVVERMPGQASEMVRDIARSSGAWRGPDAATNPDGPQGPLVAVLWTSQGRQVGQGSEQDPWQRVLPVIDPSAGGWDEPWLPDDSLQQAARRERRQAARRYLIPWAQDIARRTPSLTNRVVQLAELELDRMFDNEFVDNNLPMMLRPRRTEQEAVEMDLMFVATAYRLHPRSMAPNLFRNPNAGIAPAMAVAQSTMFLPRSRYTCCPWAEERYDPVTREPYLVVHTDGWPNEWGSSIQNWQSKLVPATADVIGSLLRVEVDPGNGQGMLPQWGMLTPEQWDALSHQ